MKSWITTLQVTELLEALYADPAKYDPRVHQAATETGVNLRERSRFFLIRIRFLWTARLAFNDMSGLSMTRKAKSGPSERHGINSKNSTKSCSSPVAHNETLRKRAKPNLSSPSGLMSLYQIRPACAGSRSFRIHPQESPL
jgi:hypothetical protein